MYHVSKSNLVCFTMVKFVLHGPSHVKTRRITPQDAPIVTFVRNFRGYADANLADCRLPLDRSEPAAAAKNGRAFDHEDLRKEGRSGDEVRREARNHQKMMQQHFLMANQVERFLQYML